MKKSLFLILMIILLFNSIGFADSMDPLEEDFIEPEPMAPSGEENYIEDFETMSVKAKVLEIIEEEKIEHGFGMTAERQIFTAEILSSKYKGKIVEVENTTSGNIAYDMKVKPGDKVLLELELYEGEIGNAYLADYVRDNYIYLLIGLFIILLIVIGKGKGIKAVFSLIITIVLIGKMLLPLILKGYNPIMLAIIVAIISTTITFVLISGFTKKAAAATVGTAGGVLIAALISMIVGRAAHLTGMSSEEAQMLMYIPQNIKFNFRDLLFTGIIIGALGAVMDVAMSIASSLEEIKKSNPSISMSKLIKSGISIGRDIMGTMSNTLILAYTGASVPLLLLFMAYNMSYTKIINLDLIATEFVRALSASIGLILAIPLTALAAGMLFSFKGKNVSQSDE